MITSGNAIDNMNFGSRERHLLKLAIEGAGIKNENTGTAIEIWVGTQEELDAIEQKDGVLYFVTE